MVNVNYQESLDYINQIQVSYKSDYTLERVTRLCKLMGRPDKKLRIVHIAGTNGKGSVGAYISNALAMCGYVVGRYLSPTVFGYRERIQKLSGNHFGVDEQWITEEEMAERMTELAAAVRTMEEEGSGHPTAFEIETVMAFCQMERWQVDVAVVEVGMGGSLDATNLIERPVLTIFTEISMDHTAELGDSLAEIAEQKFGILKAGVPVVSARQEFMVMEQLKRLCQQRGLSLRIADAERVMHMECSLSRTKFYYRGFLFRIRQLGLYQVENAVVAAEALLQMAKTGFHKVNLSSVQEALAETRWHGRFDLISRDPFLIVDGAHNPSGAVQLKKSLIRYFPSERFTFIFGVFRDKAYTEILKTLLPLARRFYMVKAAGERGVEPDELKEVLASLPARNPVAAQSCQDVSSALQEISRKGQREKIIVCGSLSFLTEVYQFFDPSRHY